MMTSSWMSDDHMARYGHYFLAGKHGIFGLLIAKQIYAKSYHHYSFWDHTKCVKLELMSDYHVIR